MSKIKLKTELKSTNGKIPGNATDFKNDSEKSNVYPVFSFKYVCEKHCQLLEWNSDELYDLVETFRSMSDVPWNELGHHSGLRLKKIDSYSKPLPQKVSPDETIYEIRAKDKKRVFGFRSRNVFNIIWFDKDHIICPYHKQRNQYG